MGLAALWLGPSPTHKLCEDTEALLDPSLQVQLFPSGNGLHRHLEILFSVCFIVLCAIFLFHPSFGLPPLLARRALGSRKSSSWHLLVLPSASRVFSALYTGLP